MDLLDAVRRESLTTGRAVFRVSDALGFAVAVMRTEPAEASEQLAAMSAVPALLLLIAVAPPPAFRAAIQGARPQLGRDRAAAPQAFAIRDGAGALFVGIEPSGAFLVAELTPDRAAFGQVRAAPVAGQPMRAAIRITLLSSARRMSDSHEL